MYILIYIYLLYKSTYIIWCQFHIQNTLIIFFSNHTIQNTVCIFKYFVCWNSNILKTNVFILSVHLNLSVIFLIYIHFDTQSFFNTQYLVQLSYNDLTDIYRKLTFDFLHIKFHCLFKYLSNKWNKIVLICQHNERYQMTHNSKRTRSVQTLTNYNKILYSITCQKVILHDHFANKFVVLLNQGLICF